METLYWFILTKNQKSFVLRHFGRTTMLRAMVNIKQNKDISKFPNLIYFLKNYNYGYRPKKLI
jgi:hypothetical protein